MSSTSRTVITALGALAALGVVAAVLVDSNDGSDGAGNWETPASLVAVTQIPGDDRENVPSALDDRFDPAFPEPLVDPNEIRSGGPPPDGIPPIDQPQFERAAEVEWLEPQEPVLALDVDGDARAYPVQVMTWHEIVNDTFGDRPVTVSYCPLCNSAVAYDRRVGDRILDFGTSGSLFNSSLVMYDRQTESLWSHFTGESVVGTLTGTQLDLIPMQTLAWADFLAENPDGLVLSRDTGFSRDYGRNPYPGYDDVGSNPFLFDGEVDGRLPAQARVVAVRGDAEAVAIDWDALFENRVVSFDFEGSPHVALLTPGTASGLDQSSVAGGRDVGATGVFIAQADQTELTFTAAEDGKTFTDDQTGSTWTITGAATSGPLQGTQLDPVEHLDTFWFAIGAFEPDTVVITG